MDGRSRGLKRSGSSHHLVQVAPRESPGVEEGERNDASGVDHSLGSRPPEPTSSGVRVRLEDLPLEIQRCLRSLDRNGDGNISLGEFENAVYAYQAMRSTRSRNRYEEPISSQDAANAVKVYDAMKTVDGGIRAAELPKSIRSYVQEFDTNKDGSISTNELVFAAHMYAYAKQSNQRLRKIIWALVVVALVFALIVFALSLAAAYLAKDVTVDSSGRLTTTGSDEAVIRTSSADVRITNSTLQDYATGRVVNVGKANSRQSLTSTMPLAAINSMEYVTLQRWGSVLRLPILSVFQRKCTRRMCKAGKQLYLSTELGTVYLCGAEMKLLSNTSITEAAGGAGSMDMLGVLAALPISDRLVEIKAAIRQLEDSGDQEDQAAALYMMYNRTLLERRQNFTSSRDPGRRLAATETGFDFYYDGSNLCMEATGERDYGTYTVAGSGSFCASASPSASTQTKTQSLTLTYTYAQAYTAEVSIALEYKHHIVGYQSSTVWRQYPFALWWYYSPLTWPDSRCDRCPCIDYRDGDCYWDTYSKWTTISEVVYIPYPPYFTIETEGYYSYVSCSSDKSATWKTVLGETLRPDCSRDDYVYAAQDSEPTYRTDIQLSFSGFGGLGPSKESKDGALAAEARLGAFPSYNWPLYEGTTWVGGSNEEDFQLVFKLVVTVKLGKRRYSYEYQLGECFFDRLDFEYCTADFSSPSEVIRDAMESFLWQFASDILTDYSLYMEFIDSATPWQLSKLDDYTRIFNPLTFIESFSDPEFARTYLSKLQAASVLASVSNYVPVIGDMISSSVNTVNGWVDDVGDFAEDAVDEFVSWFS